MKQLAWMGAGVVGGVALGGWALALPWLWGSLALFVACLPRLGAVHSPTVGLFLGLLAVAIQPAGPVIMGWTHVRGVVVGASVGKVASVRVQSIARAGGPPRIEQGRVWVRFDSRPPPPGSDVVLWGRAGPALRQALPGAPDPVRNNRRARIHTLIEVEQSAVLNPRRQRPRTLPEAPLLTALATGDRSGISRDTTRLLRRTGTAHVLAISGFHVGLVGALTGGVVLAILRAISLIHPRGVSVAPAYVVGAGIAVLYAWTAGAPTSAVRAAGLLVLLAAGRITGRSPPLLHVLAIVGGLQAALDPACVGTASFQLSYGAVLGLICVSPALLSHLPPSSPAIVRGIAGSLSATIGATIGTLGPAAWWFQSLPLLSPLANLLALPLTAFILVPCALVATWGPEPLSDLALVIGQLGVQTLLALLQVLEGPVIHPAVGPVGALFLATVPMVWRYKTLVLAIHLAVFWPRQLPQNRLTVLDVGQGDSLVVDQPDGSTWLVDTGPRRTDVLHYLRRTGRTELDVVIATHNHPDHIAGLGAIVNHLTIRELWVADTTGIENLLQLAHARGIGVRIRPGLDPNRPLTRNHNDASIVIPVLNTVLLTGDAETTTETRLIDHVPRLDVLKLGHHGSRTSTTADFLDAVDPLLAATTGTGIHIQRFSNDWISATSPCSAPLYTARSSSISLATGFTCRPIMLADGLRLGAGLGHRCAPGEHGPTHRDNRQQQYRNPLRQRQRLA
jgi:ComEC/Rec2-related protein